MGCTALLNYKDLCLIEVQYLLGWIERRQEGKKEEKKERRKGKCKGGREAEQMREDTRILLLELVFPKFLTLDLVALAPTQF